jgi:hypothetical protein
MKMATPRIPDRPCRKVIPAAINKNATPAVTTASAIPAPTEVSVRVKLNHSNHTATAATPTPCASSSQIATRSVLDNVTGDTA